MLPVISGGIGNIELSNKKINTFFYYLFLDNYFYDILRIFFYNLCNFV